MQIYRVVNHVYFDMNVFTSQNGQNGTYGIRVTYFWS